ncbi:hypothetical protein CJF30_00010833 [Rutstroemia sp. NJR-2017a BBW]|nr:hypothetical protein CJF30_00010833 [Rutstroemia sp. NJR-2017a BBW]
MEQDAKTSSEHLANSDEEVMLDHQKEERPEEENSYKNSVEMETRNRQEYGLQSSRSCLSDSGISTLQNYKDSSGSGSSKSRTTQAVAKPVLEPPVTKKTLSELDYNKIVRHDINFEPNLHFEPSFHGEKGLKKTQKANEFWDTMRLQLQGYFTDREQFERDLGDTEWCLPATLKAIRGILEILIPQRDRSTYAAIPKRCSRLREACVMAITAPEVSLRSDEGFLGG